MALGYQALTGDITSYIAANARRAVYYSNPSGAATLTGLLSLTDSEPTDGPEFSWHEDRLKEKVGTTTDFTASSVGPWKNGAGATAATFSFTAGDAAKLFVTSNEPITNWQTGERIIVHQQMNSAGTARVQVLARITGVTATTTTTGTLDLVIIETVAIRNTAATDAGNLIQSLGIAMAEGSRSPAGNAMVHPIRPVNYCQIFRKSMKWSRTVLTQPLFYDAKGPYRSHSRRQGLAHLIDIENAIMFGNRDTGTVTDIDGTPTVWRTCGGIHWFLREYEKANGGSFNYRPGGAAVTANTDDAKRIILGTGAVGAGALTYAVWTALEERIFRTSMSSMNEKLLLGGSALVKAVLEYYRVKAGGTIHVNRGFDEDTKLSFGLVSITTDYGTLHVKSHPRFNDLAYMRASGFILDIGNLKLRPAPNGDTHRNEDIGPNDFDGRMDEWFSDLSLELNFPETHMYLENVASIGTS